MNEIAPIYVAARRVLLDALAALAPQTAAIIVVGAQAIYLRTGDAEVAIAPYTTDADLAVDPEHLGAEPKLEALMSAAGFSRQSQQPGSWVTSVIVEGRPVDIPVDLMVPAALAPGGGRRSVRLPPHDKMAARKATGLEAAVLDNDLMEVAALDPNDPRRFEARVAGKTALIIAKLHKLADRLDLDRVDRIADKDSADIYRLMLATRSDEFLTRIRTLLSDPNAASASERGMSLLVDLFGAPGRRGVRMAAEALRTAVPTARVEGVCDAFVRAVRVEL